MALSIGSTAQRDTGHSVLNRAHARAALIPDLLVESRRIAATVTSGWHGRRRRGSGDTFWQFRPYDAGESMARIDWRRSARDVNSVYVRDQEWEAAHTVWVWADSSPSMLYKSRLADVSKQSRALVLALALIEILAKSGERVGWPGLTRALASRKASERIASELMVSTSEQETGFPPTAQLRKRQELVVFSDFLEPIDETLERLRGVAQLGVRGCLVQIIDPVEESFPFSGRTEFRDPETGAKLTFGRAETLLEDYRNVFEARQETLARNCQRLGWDFIVHHTDHPASTALIDLYVRLSGETEA